MQSDSGRMGRSSFQSLHRPFADECSARRQLPGKREDEGGGMGRHLLVAIVRNVDDGDAALGRRAHVDGVDPDAVASDDLPGGMSVELISANRGELDEHAVGVAASSPPRARRRRPRRAVRPPCARWTRRRTSCRAPPGTDH